MTYHVACQKAIESDSKLLKKVSASWEQTWEDIGPKYIEQQNNLIENIFKETNTMGKIFEYFWRRLDKGISRGHKTI